MFSGISWPQILILLIVVLLIFGSGRLKGVGSDFGVALRNFKNSRRDSE